MAVEYNIIEFKKMVRRRGKVFFITFSTIFFIFLFVALYLPPIYQSEATIDIENQVIPKEYVESTITTYVEERLQAVSQEVMSPGRLTEIIKNYNLYPEIASFDAKLKQMHKDINLTTIDMTLQDQKTGRLNKVSTAFNLSYLNRSPEKAETVAKTLSNLFIQEDQRKTENQATSITSFLQNEVDEMRQKVKQYEEKISRFKADNIKQLPGSTDIFLQTIARLEEDLDKIDNQIQTNQDKIVYLKSQIANIDPQLPIITDNGKEASNPINQLKYLRLKLISMEATLSDKHPDVIRLKREIKELESKVGKNNNTADKKTQLAIVNNKIAELKSQFGDKYPDVIKLVREADLLKKQISAQAYTQNTETEQSDNPGYLNIKAQIIVAQSELKALADGRERTAKKIEDYQKRLETMPFVDAQYNSLTMDLANAKKKFDEVSSKLHSAKISQAMDTSNRGERFSIESPASLPDKPFKPNRLLIMLIGFVIGMGIASLLAVLLEGMDSSVRPGDELENIIGVPVLATVSMFDSPIQKRSRRVKHLMVVATVLAVVLTASLMINWFVMPMGNLWNKFQDRLIEIGVPIDKDTKKM